jgi:glyoxylase-like metal-dependent hydrolase (beta-lactamase superfamily II)
MRLTEAAEETALKSIGRIGGVEIGRVLDTYLLGETMQAWFPDFSRDAVTPHEHWLCPTHCDSESGHFPMPVHSWLVRVGGRNVLIDTCLGNDKSRPGLAEGHMLDTRYLERLTELGLTPDDVDYVLCTHLHVDHIGWNTRLENGRWVPTFPNARYVFSRTEYEAAKKAASDPPSRPFSRQMFEDSIHPIVEAGKACLVDGVYELLGQLALRPAPGHSPGHFRIELRSQGEVGVFAGDLLHSPIQVPLWEWSTRVCWDRSMTAASRRELREFGAAENALLLPGHFLAPHVGRIKRAGGTFAIDFGW